MPLTPHEEDVLATIGENLRSDDPALAAALDRPRSERAVTPLRPVPRHPESRNPASLQPASLRPVLLRPVLLLLVALTGLVVVSAAFAEQLGVAGLAAVTAVAVVPWLVVTARRARAADRRGPDGRPVRGPVREVASRKAGRGVPIAVVGVLAAMALSPPAWQGMGVMVLTFLLAASLPRLVVRAVEHVERSRGAPRQDPSD